MLISVKWLNALLNPGPPGTAGPFSADEAERVLTFAGFPIESRTPLAGGDERLDVEVTSNRGDVLSHVGVAREIAAATGRELKLSRPAWDPARGPGSGEKVGSVASLENLAARGCPRFTARVVRNVRVGPSPAWLVSALESVGQRSINNVVDITNYVLFELGHPTHVFDFEKLAGKRIVVRGANEGEKLQTLDGKTHTLKSGELVVADAERAQGLAGIMGGEESSVTTQTRNVLIEAATWDPPSVRRVARRLQLRTDASHRYERYVDPRTTAEASARVAQLILEVAGGELMDGMLDEGPALPESKSVRMRAERCRALLGEPVATDEMARLLTALEIDAHVDRAADEVICEIPPFRADLTREVDLIEEVARTHGYARIGVDDKMDVQIGPAQESERALRVIGETMAAMGFYETITFSFVTRDEAALFLPQDMRILSVDEARRPGQPALRPSVLAGLLRCRRVNQDARVVADGGVRLFEIGPGFQEDSKGRSAEFRALAMLIDAPDAQEGLRRVRGAVESLVVRLGGAAAKLQIESSKPFTSADREGATASITLNGQKCGALRVFSDAALKFYDLDVPVAGAEIELNALLSLWPARVRAAAPPAFPAIDRDLSVIVDESVAWASIAREVERTSPARMEGFAFVGVYRGKQVGEGKKSVTMRLRFRDDARTLRHEEVDPQVAAVVESLGRAVGASLRK